MTFPPEFWEAPWLTIRLAFVSTALLLIIGLPIAQWMSRGGNVPLIAEVILTVPIALPPTVIGFYLLVIFAPQTWLGGSIAGRTKVLSITLYDEVQKMDYAAAHAYSAVLLTLAFILIFVVTLLQRGSLVAR